jgi:hypothetical protein
MDICLPELDRIEDEHIGTHADTTDSTGRAGWLVLWLAPKTEESERATHELCAALPVRTIEEARLN